MKDLKRNPDGSAQRGQPIAQEIQDVWAAWASQDATASRAEHAQRRARQLDAQRRARRAVFFAKRTTIREI